MFKNSALLLSSLLFVFNASASTVTKSKVNFLSPKDGENVSQTFETKFDVVDMSVEKAGVMKEKTGHHHLIIDGGPVKKGEVIPKDETHKHFGDASTSTKVTLTPGKHTLTLQFADGAHKSYGEEYSSTITVNVK